jgi:tetratricopeptide (TPR) repeat protein
VIFSFEHLFPFLKAGGIYVIEDMFLHTGSSEDAHLGHADMSPPKYLFELSRMLMWQGVDPAKNFGSWASFRRQIDEIAFVPNGAAFIRKKQEDDPTSLTAQAEAYAQQKGTALGWSRAADYIQRKGGSLARAEAAAATAIKLEPASSPAYLSLSQIQIARSDFDGATRSALHAAELAPGHAAAWQHLAQIYSRQNDFAQAETAFRKAIRANDKQFASYDGLGRVLARQQKTAEARDVLNAGLAANPPSGWQDILKRSLAEVPGI